MTIQTKDRNGADLDLAAKNIGGVEYPRNILTDPAGNELTPASESAVNALATLLAGLLTNAQLRAAPLDVSGEVALDAGTVSALTTGGGLTDTQLRAAPVPTAVQDELIEAISAMRVAINGLNRAVGLTMPDALGRMRIIADTNTSINVNAITTLPTLAAVTTLSTLTNQAQIGGFSANDELPALMRASFAALRNNITVS